MCTLMIKCFLGQTASRNFSKSQQVSKSSPPSESSFSDGASWQDFMFNITP
jgi:hypothetical protein